MLYLTIDIAVRVAIAHKLPLSISIVVPIVIAHRLYLTITIVHRLSCTITIAVLAGVTHSHSYHLRFRTPRD